MRALPGLVFSVLLLRGALAAPPVASDYAAHGRLIVAALATAPFPHPDRAAGHTYQGKHYPAADHYTDNTVALFIPHGFRETDRIDLVVHFHGWRNDVAGTLRSFRLPEQFAASRKNAVLVVPEGPRLAPDSFGGKLEDPEGFKRFVAEVTATLRARAGFRAAHGSVGRIILSGHSGGYRVIAGILDRGGLTDQVSEVWLFDALYGRSDSYVAWADRTRGRLLNIYTDRGGTKAESEKLRDRLAARGTPLLASAEATLDPAALRTGRFVFIHTDLGHDDVLAARDQFALFLRTSVLADR